MRLPVLAALAAAVSAGLVLQILGCALWMQWAPLLALPFWALVPLPHACSGAGGSSDYVLYGGGADAQAGWSDVAQFLLGLGTIGVLAVPSVLYHAGLITLGALLLEAGGALVLALTAGAFYVLVRRADSYEYGGY